MEEIKTLKDYEKVCYNFSNVRLEISKNGFSLWDKKSRRWLIDASLYEENELINIGDRTFTVGIVEAVQVRELEEKEE